MIKPIWRAPHNDYFTNWMDSRSRMSMPSMAGSHGGGKMEDCSKKENADKPECKKK